MIIPRPARFKVPKVSICMVHWSPTTRPGYAATPIFSDPLNVLYAATEARYESYDPETLWLAVTCNTMNDKAVVRRWCSRRLKAAFLDALRSRGFDREGRPLAAKDKRKGGLKGLIVLSGVKPLKFASGSEVKKQTEAIVKRLEMKRKDVI
ncbi:hypothetical protein MMC20_005366 [Loxospora ochrophaea]|nr:hypothetical protein [Loxospora ochrophaea]